MPATRPATVAGFAAIVLWASLALLATFTASIPPFQQLALGFGIAGAAGLAWNLRPGGGGLAALRQPPAAAALTIAALFGYHALYFVALKRAPVVEASLVNYLWPLLIVVFAAGLGGARIAPAQWLGTALGLLAAALVVTRGGRPQLDPADAAGYVAALGAAVVWALYSVLNRRYAAVPSATITVACAATGVLGALAHAAFETWVAPTPAQWAALVALGLGPTGIAFWLWDIGTKRGDIAVLGTLSYAAPLLSTALLLLFGRAAPHWSQAVAVALLLAGAWLSVRAAPAPSAEHPPAE
jgi:drug/metabolite transporter (DMT)-like permease